MFKGNLSVTPCTVLLTVQISRIPGDCHDTCYCACDVISIPICLQDSVISGLQGGGGLSTTGIYFLVLSLPDMDNAS